EIQKPGAAAIGRGSWANRQCVGLGRSGVVLRLQGAAIDVPWDRVTAIRALAPDWQGATARSRYRKVPVLLIERGDEHWAVNPAVLDASPIALYAMLHHYWLHPAERAELGTVAAQQRMEAWVASMRAPGAQL
ncbi:MAG: hypothetical protein J0H64_06135, partial [Actinobacteria bacterium]|nr:hypothetical protein [Actinomycetota bacterium]